MPAACLDIDNTIVDADTVFRQIIMDATGGRVDLRYEDIKCYDYFRCSDSRGASLQEHEWPAVLANYANHIRFLKLLPGALEGMRALHEAGVSLHLATARKRNARIPTVVQLDLLRVPDHHLHFLAAGAKHASLQGFDFAVEDFFDQAAAFAMNGTPCYLIDHPWNRCGDVPGVIRVSGWEELMQHYQKGG